MLQEDYIIVEDIVLEGCCRVIQKWYKGDTWGLEYCYSDVTKLLQRSHGGVTWVLKGFHTYVTGLLYLFYSGVTGLLNV